MIEEIYRDPRTIRRYRSTFLSIAINTYLEEFLKKGYPTHLIKKRLPVLYDFSEYLSRNGLSNLQQLESYLHLYLEEKRERAMRGEGHNSESILRERRCHLSHFLEHLVSREFIEDHRVSSSSLGNYQELLDDFADFLKTHKGMSGSSQYYYRLYIERFLRFKEEKAIGDGGEIGLTLKDFYQFIQQEGEHYQRNTLNCICAALRAFCRYLFMLGKIPQDYSALLERPRLYQGERCIRYLSPQQMAQVLESADHDTPLGSRNYAILILLRSYGLRGKEVVHLCLDDIDWREERIRISRRKCGDTRELPLLISVGEALIPGTPWVLKVRPKLAYREIFLTIHVPIVPLKNVSQICQKAIIKAGIQIPRAGSHTFRYSCAQRLFQEGYPLKWIADTLGHQDIHSTNGYLNIALYPLREVCQNDAEDLL